MEEVEIIIVCVDMLQIRHRRKIRFAVLRNDSFRRLHRLAYDVLLCAKQREQIGNIRKQRGGIAFMQQREQQAVEHESIHKLIALDAVDGFDQLCVCQRVSVGQQVAHIGFIARSCRRAVEVTHWASVASAAVSTLTSSRKYSSGIVLRAAGWPL